MADPHLPESYRAGFNKLLWAMPIAHAAGLLAILQLLGDVPDPDFAFRALRSTIISLGVGGAAGLSAILFAQMTLMDQLMFEHHLRRMQEGEGPERKFAGRKAERSVTSGMYMEFIATGLNFGSLAALVFAGNLAFSAVDGGRLQPRDESSAPDRMIEVLQLLNELNGRQPATTPAPTPAPIPPNPPR